MSKLCTDHLGNNFSSKKEMCEHWGVTVRCLDYRLSNGYTLEEALTYSIGKKRKYTECTDHLGNKFNMIKDMCEYWNIDANVFSNRYHGLGWSLKDALETPSRNLGVYTDHVGNRFKNETELCEFWGINYKAYKKRLDRGCTVKDSILRGLEFERKRRGA